MSDTAIKYRDEQVLEGYLEKVNPINPVSPTKDWQKMLRDSLDITKLLHYNRIDVERLEELWGYVSRVLEVER